MPLSEITATSEVPPPISITMQPRGSCTASPAPIAADIGSSIRKTSRAPAPAADSLMARRSTWVEPQGTQMSTRGLGRKRRDSCTLWMKYCSIFSVTVKSAMTPSFIGRIAVMFCGVRPSICLASSPTATTDLGSAGALVTDRHHRGLIEHDPLAAGIDQRVGGAKIDRQIVGEHPTNASEKHQVATFQGMRNARAREASWRRGPFGIRHRVHWLIGRLI